MIFVQVKNNMVLLYTSGKDFFSLLKCLNLSDIPVWFETESRPWINWSMTEHTDVDLSSVLSLFSHSIQLKIPS